MLAECACLSWSSLEVFAVLIHNAIKCACELQVHLLGWDIFTIFTSLSGNNSVVLRQINRWNYCCILIYSWWQSNEIPEVDMVTDNTSHGVLTSTYTVEQLQVGMDDIYPQGLHLSWGRREGGAGSKFDQAAVFRKGNYQSKMGGGDLCEPIWGNPNCACVVSSVTNLFNYSRDPSRPPKDGLLAFRKLMPQQLGRPFWHRWVFASSPLFTKGGTARTNTGTLMNSVRHCEKGRLGGNVSEDTMWSLGQKKTAGRGKLKSSLESLIKMCKFCRCSVRWPGLGKQLVYSFTICLWSRDNWIDKLLLPGQL